MTIEKDFKNTLTVKDYVNYLVSNNILLLCSPVLICVLLAAGIYSIITEGFNVTSLIYFLPIALFIASYIKMYRVIKQTLKAQQSINELKITLTDNEYKDCTNGNIQSITYDKLYCYKETKKYFYLYPDQYNALILPKRKFHEHELDKMQKTFNQKMKRESIFNLRSLLYIGTSVVLIVLIVINIFFNK